MKIDKRVTPPATSKVAASKTQPAGKPAAPAASKSDTVTLTQSSTRIRALESQLASVDISNTSKVQAVKAALDSGQFAVDAEVVADRLIDHTKESLRKRPRKK